MNTSFFLSVMKQNNTCCKIDKMYFVEPIVKRRHFNFPKNSLSVDIKSNLTILNLKWLAKMHFLKVVFIIGTFVFGKYFFRAVKKLKKFQFLYKWIMNTYYSYNLVKFKIVK